MHASNQGLARHLLHQPCTWVQLWETWDHSDKGLATGAAPLMVFPALALGRPPGQSTALLLDGDIPQAMSLSAGELGAALKRMWQ